MNINEYKDIWIIAEQEKGQIHDVSFELLTRAIILAKKRNCKIIAILFADVISDVELNKLFEYGADDIILITHKLLDYFLPEPYSMCLLDLLKKYKPEIILAAATSMGRTLMPYLAVKATTGLTADCTELKIEKNTGTLLQIRPAIGGNIMATIKTPNHRPQILTIRPKSTIISKPKSSKLGNILRITPKNELLKSNLKKIDFIQNKNNFNLQNAEKVVVLGRGIKSPENIPLFQNFADQIGASIAATRDIVDREWLPYSHQVGLSGKTILPKLYIGLGVSGAIQHLAGMQTSEFIIAVNKDTDAPIFKVADFGIVGDIFEVIPNLTKYINKAF